MSRVFVLDANDNIGGAGLGTFTLRYPIGCSRFAPYIWGGFGALGGGSHTDRFFVERSFLTMRKLKTSSSDITSQQPHPGDRSVQVGGLEVRITRHIGVMGDFAWNVVQERG